MRVLFLSPHADDAELWAGGTIASHPEWQIMHLILTGNSTPERSEEIKNAGRVLGVEAEVYHFEDTKLYESVEDIRELFEELQHGFAPELVFCPPAGDRHQDHQTVYEEARRAFRFCSMLGYDTPYNEPANRPTCYLPITKDNIGRKIEACRCYESQAHQPYMQPEVIESLARVRGCEIRTEFAEAVEVVRWIL